MQPCRARASAESWSPVGKENRAEGTTSTLAFAAPTLPGPGLGANKTVVTNPNTQVCPWSLGEPWLLESLLLWWQEEIAAEWPEVS